MYSFYAVAVANHPIYQMRNFNTWLLIIIYFYLIINLLYYIMIYKMQPWVCSQCNSVVWCKTSWTTIVVHSRNDEEVRVAHKVKSPENQPQFIQMRTWQYRLGKTKPKEAFRSTWTAFKKLTRNLKNIYLMEFSTDWLIDWLTNWCLQTSVRR